MAAKASGTAATARATANITILMMNPKSIRSAAISLMILIPATRKQIPRAMMPSHFPISSVLFSRGVASVSTDITSLAIFPNSVFIPV